MMDLCVGPEPWSISFNPLLIRVKKMREPCWISHSKLTKHHGGTSL